MQRILASLILILAPAASGADLVEPVNATRGVAIGGYDPVAYFEQSKAVKGSDRFTHSWMGATWRFASAGHRDRFAAAPEMYAPQYGGYCSYAVSENYTAGIDPEAWKIVDGKLYLNYSKSVRKGWERDQARRIAAADRNWPGLHK
jgi:hypothetical protein